MAAIHDLFYEASRVRCPSRSKADVLLVVTGPVDVACGVAARHLWTCSQIAALAARSTGGWSASFTCGGRVNLSRICIVVAATPWATVAAKSGVDMVLWVTGGGRLSELCDTGLGLLEPH